MRGQFLSHTADGGGYLRGVPRRTNVQRTCAGAILKQRHVDERRVRFGQAVVLGVAGHADNLTIEFFAEEFEPLADGGLIGPKAPGHGLVDDHDLRSALSVLLAEIAALQQWNAQRLEEPQSRVVELYKHPAAIGRGRLAFKKDAPQNAAAEGAAARNRQGLHAGQRGDALHQLPLEADRSEENTS